MKIKSTMHNKIIMQWNDVKYTIIKQKYSNSKYKFNEIFLKFNEKAYNFELLKLLERREE